MSELQKSPFKFLDAYQEEDIDIFFGREEETEALYDALSGVKHLLVYGPSGAGKTSLVECGLRNQFSDADWFALTIRKGAHISASVFRAINAELSEENRIALTPEGLPQDAEEDFGEAVERLFDERYQPVYLLFDQFEELFVSGTPEEQNDFFDRLNRLIRFKVPCRILLILREEFIGYFSEFEERCPTIFQHRFRLEKMRTLNVAEVITQTLDAPEYAQSFEATGSAVIAEKVLSRLPDQRREIELTHVQVFLNELWERAHAQQPERELPVLSPDLIRDEDQLESILENFLKKQLAELQTDYGDRFPLEVLALLTSERGTKFPRTEAELHTELQAKQVSPPAGTTLPTLLAALTARKLLREARTDNQTQYEISHDVLALVIRNNLTDEIRLREAARQRYALYLERTGYFSQGELDDLRPFAKYLPYPDKLAEKVSESEAHLKAEQEKERRKQRRVIAVVSMAALLALGFGVFGFYQRGEAIQERDNAREQEELAKIERNNARASLRAALKADKERLEADIENLLNRADMLRTLNKDADAKATRGEVAQIQQQIDSLNQEIKQIQ